MKQLATRICAVLLALCSIVALAACDTSKETQGTTGETITTTQPKVENTTADNTTPAEENTTAPAPENTTVPASDTTTAAAGSGTTTTKKQPTTTTTQRATTTTTKKPTTTTTTKPPATNPAFNANTVIAKVAAKVDANPSIDWCPDKYGMSGEDAGLGWYELAGMNAGRTMDYMANDIYESIVDDYTRNKQNDLFDVKYLGLDAKGQHRFKVYR